MRRVQRVIHQSRVVDLKEKLLDSSVNIRYLYSDGELEGGRKRATDPNWSLNPESL